MREPENLDESYVVHPRYGDKPRFTQLEPKASKKWGLYFHWHSHRDDRIPGTAVAADIEKQNFLTMPVTHYFDVRRRCLDCGRNFLFFADEQKHWYEELRLLIEVDCVRCTECRPKRRSLARRKRRYEELHGMTDRTGAEELELAECMLDLIEGEIFRLSDRLHGDLNRMLKLGAREADLEDRCAAIRERVGRLQEGS